MMEQEQDNNDVAREDEGQHASFRKIEELESFGVNKTDLTKLKSGGYHTIESVGHIAGLIL